MSIKFEILGGLARDNALHVTVDSGQNCTQLLFDCGEGCLDSLSIGRRRDIDGLFFSHLHMDHISGFDGFFRQTFGREGMSNRIWGPRETATILQHRFQGFLWNMLGDVQAQWIVEDITSESISTARFELSEAFATRHDERVRSHTGRIWETTDFTVDAVVMDHGTDCIAYILRETPNVNIDMQALGSMGLKPGPWMQALKGDADHVTIDGEEKDLAALRRDLLVKTPGQSIAYFTDFYLDDAGIERVLPQLEGCETLICEAQYRHEDLDLAKRNHHMTAQLSARLAAAAGVGQMILFHISERYDRDGQDALLAEAQSIFPETSFPDHW